MTPTRWLPWVAVAIAAGGLGKPPALDEESYLWIAQHLDPLRPYAWSRVWPPYDPDGFVFAHPPLHLWWIWLWGHLPLVLARAGAGLPFAALLGWATARLAERHCDRPGLAAGLWACSTAVVLGLQDTLMIDLPVAALVTAGLAVDRPRVAGLLFGLAFGWKYPALLVVPVLVMHRRWTTLGVSLAVLAAVEGFVGVVHGRFHLWEVLSRADEIARGPMADRAIGTLARLALLPLAIGAFRDRVAWVGAIAGALVALVHPPLLPWTVLGGLALSQVRRDALLGGVVVCWVLGVVLGHNYAATRYLLPAAAPLAILVARSGTHHVAIWVSALVAALVAGADSMYTRAGVTVARRALEKVTTPCRFVGEWSFRWGMEPTCTRYREGETLEPATWIVVVDNASPGAVDSSHWEPMARVESPERFPVRVNDPLHGVSLYAETLGPLPLGWRPGPLEGATLYRTRP